MRPKPKLKQKIGEIHANIVTVDLSSQCRRSDFIYLYAANYAKNKSFSLNVREEENRTFTKFYELAYASSASLIYFITSIPFQEMYLVSIKSLRLGYI